jgi:hypothetical protein
MGKKAGIIAKNQRIKKIKESKQNSLEQYCQQHCHICKPAFITVLCHSAWPRT